MNTLENFDDVHTKVLRQHAEIRGRLRALEAAAVTASADDLRTALLRLAAIFEAHLAYEERELAPRVHEIDAWGPERESAMLAEHIEQRSRLEAICAAAIEDPATARGLAGNVRWLVTTLLEDMDEEERWLVELDRIEQSIVVDQFTG